MCTSRSCVASGPSCANICATLPGQPGILCTSQPTACNAATSAHWPTTHTDSPRNASAYSCFQGPLGDTALHPMACIASASCVVGTMYVAPSIPPATYSPLSSCANSASILSEKLLKSTILMLTLPFSVQKVQFVVPAYHAITCPSYPPAAPLAGLLPPPWP